jgi:hypothetical protein
MASHAAQPGPAPRTQAPAAPEVSLTEMDDPTGRETARCAATVRRS